MSKVRPAQPAPKWVRDGIFESRGENQMAPDLITIAKNINDNPRWRLNIGLSKILDGRIGQFVDILSCNLNS